MTPYSWPVILFVAWAVVAFLLLLRLAVSAWALQRLAHRGSPAPDTLQPTFAEVCRELGISPRRARLVLGCTDCTPMTWGLVSSIVLLPDSAAHWNSARLRSVLLHELIHVRRHDARWSLLSRLVVALQWPNPLAWLASAAVDRERERACDAATISVGVDRQQYAQHLLETVAEVRPARIPALGLAMARVRQLEGRLNSILDPSLKRSSRGVTIATAALLICGAGVVTVFGEEKKQTEQAPEPARTADQDKITPEDPVQPPAPEPVAPEPPVAPPAPEPKSSAPPVKDLPTIKLDEKEFVTIANIAKEFNFRVAGNSPADSFHLTHPTLPTAISGTVKEFDLTVGDIKVRMDDPVRRAEGTFLLSKRTVVQVLEPILRPRAMKLSGIDTVIIDAGHGGPDSGAVRAKVVEKTLNLTLAKELAAALKEVPVKVILTRNDDKQNISLKQRVAIGEQHPHALFISLHANAASRSSLRGIETYITSERSRAATVFGAGTHGLLIRATGANDRGLRAARYSVLSQKNPSLVIETGFLSNSKERAQLLDPNYRRKITSAIVDSIKLYREIAGKPE